MSPREGPAIVSMLSEYHQHLEIVVYLALIESVRPHLKGMTREPAVVALARRGMPIVLFILPVLRRDDWCKPQRTGLGASLWKGQQCMRNAASKVDVQRPEVTAVEAVGMRSEDEHLRS